MNLNVKYLSDSIFFLRYSVNTCMNKNEKEKKKLCCNLKALICCHVAVFFFFFKHSNMKELIKSLITPSLYVMSLGRHKWL